MPAENSVRGLIPIVLGVVGHRNISPDVQEALRKKLGLIFDDFDRAYPDSPKILLSSLAPGADQLAARIAVDRDGWSVRSPLPFELDVFKKSTSFQVQKEHEPKVFDEDGLKKFGELKLNPKVQCFVVPMPPDQQPAGGKWEMVAAAVLGESDKDRDLRHACYANAGGYIVRHSHTLIALWDGDRKCERPAGTDEIVRFKLGGLVPSLYPRLADEPLGFDSDRGPVIVLHTPRAGAGTENAAREIIRVPTKDEADAAGAEQIEQKLDPAFGVEIHLKKFAWRKWRVRRLWERTKLALHLEGRRDSWFRRTWQGLLRFLRVEKGREEYDQFLTICQNIDDFNRERREIPPDQAVYGQNIGQRLAEVDKDVDKVFPVDPGGKPGAQASPNNHPDLRSCYRNVLDVYEVADHRAGRLAPLHEWAGLALFVLLFLALLSFHYYAHPIRIELEMLVLVLTLIGAVWVVLALFWDRIWWAGLGIFVPLFLLLLIFHINTEEVEHTQPHSTLLLGVFGAVWAVLAGLVGWAWWVRLDDRRLDYRALAEALRVRRAWVQGGVGRSVASSYLGQLRSEMVWVRRALQHLSPPPEFWQQEFDNLDTDDRRIERLQYCARWIHEQEKQHRKAKKREQYKAFLFRTSGFFIGVIGLIVLACLWRKPSKPVEFMLIAGSLLIIMGGLLIAFCERRAHEELSKQYERMHAIFRNGAVEFARALGRRDIARAQAILVQLGHEAIQENAQWLILRRSRPLELPLGA